MAKINGSFPEFSGNGDPFKRHIHELLASLHGGSKLLWESEWLARFDDGLHTVPKARLQLAEGPSPYLTAIKDGAVSQRDVSGNP